MEVANKINGVAPMDDQIIERVIALGDLKLLKADERNSYYLAICKSLNLNPLTRPLEYLTLNGKMVLYAEGLHGAAAQTPRCFDHEDRDRRARWRLQSGDAKTKDREDVDFGAVSIKGLAGDALVNAKLKAITKAKRRVTLSICGLELDKTEIETIPTAAPHSQPAQIEAGEPEGLITRAQRKDMNDWIGKLKVKFGLTNEILATKMRDATGCERSADLTIEQADEHDHRR